MCVHVCGMLWRRVCCLYEAWTGHVRLQTKCALLPLGWRVRGAFGDAQGARLLPCLLLPALLLAGSMQGMRFFSRSKRQPPAQLSSHRGYLHFFHIRSDACRDLPKTSVELVSAQDSVLLQ